MLFDYTSLLFINLNNNEKDKMLNNFSTQINIQIQYNLDTIRNRLIRSESISILEVFNKKVSIIEVSNNEILLCIALNNKKKNIEINLWKI